MIHRRDFLKLLHDFPSVAIALLKELTMRLRKPTHRSRACRSRTPPDASRTWSAARGRHRKIRKGRVEIDELPSSRILPIWLERRAKPFPHDHAFIARPHRIERGSFSSMTTRSQEPISVGGTLFFHVRWRCMEGKADLHIHTTHSDGAFSARAIVGHARRAGLTTISITDHDSTAALTRRSWQAECEVAVIPGVELSTCLDGQDVQSWGISSTTRTTESRLTSRSAEGTPSPRERIVGRLNALNVPLPFEAFLTRLVTVPSDDHTCARNGGAGLTQSYHEAF